MMGCGQSTESDTPKTSASKLNGLNNENKVGVENETYRNGKTQSSHSVNEQGATNITDSNGTAQHIGSNGTDTRTLNGSSELDALKTSLALPPKGGIVQANIRATDSQIDFFRMLDEKIEKGRSSSITGSLVEEVT